jgi:transposase InsO family protein
VKSESEICRKADGRKVLSDEERRRLEELAHENEICGYRKVWALGEREGIEIGATTVYRALKTAGLSLPRDYAKVAKRRAKRPFIYQPQQINEEWQTDISEFLIATYGKQYFMAVEDVFSRYILAWTLSPTQTADVAADLMERAWEEALRLCGWIPDTIRVKTDNGGQYRSQVWQEYLEAEEKRFKHERTAYCSPEEIGYIESFHSKLKVEEIYQRDYDDPIEAFRSIHSWIEKYNHYRPHQGLNYRVPAEVYAEAALTMEAKTS